MSQQKEVNPLQNSRSEFNTPTEEETKTEYSENNHHDENNNNNIKYIAQFHTSNWYCQERGKEMEPNCLKYELDHIYMKREYTKVVELIFKSIGMQGINQEFNDGDELLSYIFSDDSIANFLKMFKLLKVPIVIRREILDTFLRCLLKIMNNMKGDTGAEYMIIKYLNVIEYEIIRKNGVLPKSQKFSKSHVASFMTQIWEFKARVLIHVMKNTKLNKYLLTQCIGLLQRCIHVKESLLFLISDEIKKKDVTVNEQGVDIRFKFTVIDTCYQTNIRSYSFWKVISECYELLEMDTCSKKCTYHANSLTRCYSLFTHLQNTKTYTKEKINMFTVEEEKLESSYLRKDISKDIPEEIKDIIILDDSEDNMFEFDRKFVDIYINNGRTIYSILSEQRGMKSNETLHDNMPSREGDDDAPRTFDASQL